MKLKKKWLAAGCVVLLLFIACIYIFIPKEMGVMRRRLIRCNAVGGFGSIGDEGAWKRWWPEGVEKGMDGGPGYRVTGHAYPSVGVGIAQKGCIEDGIITVLTAGTGDSIEVLW